MKGVFFIREFDLIILQPMPDMYHEPQHLCIMHIMDQWTEFVFQ